VINIANIQSRLGNSFRMPILSLVKLDMMLPPALSSEMLTCGWLYSSMLEVLWPRTGRLGSEADA
jgi:hypothetical protein